MLDDDLKDNTAFRELKSDVFSCRSDLAELCNSVKPLLGCDDHAPLTAILLLQELDQHIGSIVSKAFRSDRANNIVLAEVFEVLICGTDLAKESAIFTGQLEAVGLANFPKRDSWEQNG